MTLAADATENAKEKGREARRQGLTYLAAMNRCPFQVPNLRKAFAEGWSEQDVKSFPTPTGRLGEQSEDF